MSHFQDSLFLLCARSCTASCGRGTLSQDTMCLLGIASVRKKGMFRIVLRDSGRPYQNN